MSTKMTKTNDSEKRSQTVVGEERVSSDSRANDQQLAPDKPASSPKQRSSPRMVQDTALSDAPTSWGTRALPVLQRLSERFISAHVGTERAGFSFEPSEPDTNNSETDEKRLSTSPPLTESQRTEGSPPKRYRNVWENVFHPGGRSYPGKSHFDTDDSSATGEPSGQSISEIYSRRFSAEQRRDTP